MSFLKSFFAAMAANEISDRKRQEEANRKAEIDSCNNAQKILLAEYDFLKYLEQIHCNDASFESLASENGLTSSCDVLYAQQIIDCYKRQLNEFMRYGGNPKYVKKLDKLDLYIDIIKRLKEYGWLDKQQKYIEYVEDTDALDLDWELEQINHQINNTVSYEDINSLSGVEFEQVCKRLLENMGFSVETTKTTGDGGIDLIAYNTQPLLSGKYIIQCKRYTGSVGEPIIRDLYGVVTAERANKGILMTTGHFTKSALAFATGKPLEMIDGIALKNLLSQHGLNVATSTVTTAHVSKPFVDVTQGMSMDEIVQENWELEDCYDEYRSLKTAADGTTDEKVIAEYINWLLEKNDFENFILCDFSQRRICFHETNVYIKKYLQERKSEKSKLLSYLYQMIYVQNSILLERFTDAKAMFIEMMKDQGIQFTMLEAMRETQNTADIFENTGVFSFLFATWCNMYQIAFVCGDTGLREYLANSKIFDGVPILQNTRIEDNLNLIRSGNSGLNELYFQKQQKLIEEISEWYNCEPVQMQIFFKIDKCEIVKSFYNYSYNGGETTDDLIDFCDYTLEDGKIELHNYGTIDLKNALSAYTPFSENDLS